MATKMHMFWLCSGLLLACNKGAASLNSSSSSRNERTGAVTAPKVTVPTVENKATGANTASVSAKSSVTQVVPAASDTNIAGAGAEFPPGTLAVNTQISIAPGEGLANAQVASQLGISQTVASGNSVSVTSSVPMDTAEPFVVALPLPDTSQSSLRLAGDPYANLVVLYHVVKASAGGADFTGLIPRSGIDVSSGFARISTTYFGTFQTVIAAAPVAAIEVAAAPAFTTAPVVPGLSFTPRNYYVSGAAAMSFGDNAPQASGGLQGFGMWASPAHVAVQGQSLTVEPTSAAKPGE